MNFLIILIAVMVMNQAGSGFKIGTISTPMYIVSLAVSLISICYALYSFIKKTK